MTGKEHKESPECCQDPGLDLPAGDMDALTLWERKSDYNVYFLHVFLILITTLKKKNLPQLTC